VEQLAHPAIVGLPVAFFQTGAAQAYIDGIRDLEMKRLLLKGGDWTLNEGLKKAMKMKTSKAAAEPPARLQELTGALARASQLSDRRREG